MTLEETAKLTTFIAATYFNKSVEVSAMSIQAWGSYLEPFTLGQAKEAFDDWVKAGKEWPPTIAELYKIITNNIDSQADKLRLPTTGDDSTTETYEKTFTENGKPVKRFYLRATREFKKFYMKKLKLREKEFCMLPTGERGTRLVRDE